LTSDWGVCESEESFYSDIPEYRKIAETLGCKATDVGRAFDGLDSPSEYSRKQLLEYDRLVQILKVACPAAEALESALQKLDPISSDVDGVPQFEPNNLNYVMITEEAKIGLNEIRSLTSALKRHRENFAAQKSRLPRNGRTGEPAPAIIHEGLKRLFKRLNLEIKFGHDPVDHEPNTKFSRAAKTAFLAYDLKTDWRRSTEEWCSKHKSTLKN